MSKDNFYKFIAVGVLIIVGVYFLYLLPKQNKEKLDFEKQKYEEEQLQTIVEDMEEKKTEEDKKEGYVKCLQKVVESYQENWKQECIRLGRKIDSSGWNCLLPEYNKNSLDGFQKQGIQLCKDYYEQ